MVYFVDDPSQKWELDVNTYSKSVVITAHKGAHRLQPFCIWVEPPNFIERIIGITFGQKVKKVKEKAQRKIDKLNADIESANTLAGIKPFDFSKPPQGGSGLPSKVRVKEEGNNSMKKSTHYQIVGCNHRFTCDDEKYCRSCELQRTDQECIDDIAVGERAYIYEKFVRK